MATDKSKIKGLLFDMDGTLVDHVETLTRCFQYSSRELGYPEPTKETVLRSIGGSMPVTIQKFLPPEKVEKGIALWKTHFEEIHLEGVVVMPGARELLEYAQEKQIAAAVFTNKTGTHTRAIIEQEGLSDLVTFCLGAEDTPYRKPNPEFSQIAIERLNLPAENVAMIGDSPFDIQAAKTVGMLSLCVATGSHNREELASEGADHVFENFEELLAWLKP